MVAAPDWLRPFVNSALAVIVVEKELAQIGCHIYQDDRTWEITLFVSSTEIVGGPHDGKLRRPTFSVDIGELLSLFRRVDALYWQAQPLDPSDEVGAHLSIEGVRCGQAIWLRILARQPDCFPVGSRIHLPSLIREAVW